MKTKQTIIRQGDVSLIKVSVGFRLTSAVEVQNGRKAASCFEAYGESHWACSRELRKYRSSQAVGGRQGEIP